MTVRVAPVPGKLASAMATGFGAGRPRRDGERLSGGKFGAGKGGESVFIERCL
jgi:hypothetical protein